jgi:hypothetical protein
MFDETRAHKLEELANLSRESGDHETEVKALEAMRQMKSDLLDKLKQETQPIQKLDNSQVGEITPGDYPEVPQVNPDGSVPQNAQLSTPPSQPEPSLFQKIGGLAETAVALGAGGLANALGNAYGSVKGIAGSVLNGTFGTNAGANAAEQVAVKYGEKFSRPFMPISQTGQDYTQNVGGALSPLAGLAPFTQELGIIGAGAKYALPQAENAFNALSGRNQNRAMAERIAAGGTERDLAPYMLDAAPPVAPAKNLSPIEYTGSTAKPITEPVVEPPIQPVQRPTKPAKLVKDSPAKEAIKQGFDTGTIAAIKATSPENKAKLLRMANISEKGKNDSVFGSRNRPSDIVGDSLAQRLNYVRKIKSDAGNELETVAGTLKGQKVNTVEAVDSFISDLDSAGVKMDKRNNPIYKGSDFEGDEKSQKILNIIIGRAKNATVTDAYGAHNLKRYIDDKTNYGVSKEGLSGDAERIVKKFRANIDGSLDSAFDDYNSANTKYADTITALNDFQKAAGSSVDLFGDNSDKALGSVSRRLLSNAQSRVNLMDSIKSVEDVSKKYGAKFNDDIITQVMFADELDKIFGAHSKTSLLGDVEKGAATGIKNAQRDLGQTTVLGAALQVAAKGYDYVNRITPERQYQSIKRLLSRDAKKDSIEDAQ